MQGATLPLPLHDAPERPWPVGTSEAWALGDRFPLGPDGLLHRVEELCSAHDRATSAEWAGFPLRLRVTASGWTASLCTLTGEWRATKSGRGVISRLPSLRHGVRTVAAADARTALVAHMAPRAASTAAQAALCARIALESSGGAYPLHILPDGDGIAVRIERSDFTKSGDPLPGASRRARRPRVPDPHHRAVTMHPDRGMWRVEFECEYPPGDPRNDNRAPEILTERTLPQVLRLWCSTTTGRVQ